MVKRNALIHAHPCSDNNDVQILSYQTTTSKSPPNMKWPKIEVEKVIAETDEIACIAGEILDKLRWPSGLLTVGIELPFLADH